MNPKSAEPPSLCDPALAGAAESLRLALEGCGRWNCGSLAPVQSQWPLLDGMYVPIYVCPSASLEEVAVGQPYSMMTGNYIGILGAAFRNRSTNLDAEVVGGCSGPNDGSILAHSGILMENDSVSFKDITDSSSNTMMVAEQSSVTVPVAITVGGQTQIVLRDFPNLQSSYYGSIWGGTTLPRAPQTGAPVPSCHFVYNVTTSALASA